MASNTGKLKGRTIFITGASRGIGKAIALKCARDGANIVIAAKTAEPHAKLQGTIYTAAQEIEAAGGRCLPCIVDVRYEGQVRNAIEQAVATFGGIDILVNNASAVSRMSSESSEMKKYDLMMNINVRGTFLCSRYAIPHLRKSTNPHILNISPPLNMDSRLFANHVVHSTSKYGMSMCALGMARELAPDGIAVNAVWPLTLIYTAAVSNIWGPEARAGCRTVDIMSDAAYVMLTMDSRQFTGNFCIDEDVLRKEGITDFKQYKCVPDGKLVLSSMVDPSLQSRI